MRWAPVAYETIKIDILIANIDKQENDEKKPRKMYQQIRLLLD
jgi:hypothetical protein